MSETSKRPIVVKIGGSTLGAEDTTLDDVVALHQAGSALPLSMAAER